MKCRVYQKSTDRTDCRYCVHPDNEKLNFPEDDVQNLKKIRSSLIRKLLIIEQKLLDPKRKKGGE